MKKLIVILISILLIINNFSLVVFALPKIQVTSSDFNNKGTIPDIHACSFIGEDKSPALSFSNLPNGTQSIAVIMFDPDAPDKNFVHWIIFNIPANNPNLNQGLSLNATLENGIKQGTNGTEQIGYFGPCPPPKENHRYIFKTFALDTVLDLEGGAIKNELQKAMKGHIIGRGKLLGFFKNNTNN